MPLALSGSLNTMPILYKEDALAWLQQHMHTLSGKAFVNARVRANSLPSKNGSKSPSPSIEIPNDPTLIFDGKVPIDI